MLKNKKDKYCYLQFMYLETGFNNAKTYTVVVSLNDMTQ